MSTGGLSGLGKVVQANTTDEVGERVQLNRVLFVFLDWRLRIDEEVRLHYI